MSYQYSVVRFVPDAARAEAVNLGIVAGDDETLDWDLRLAPNMRRARALDAGQNCLPAALSFTADLQGHVDAVSDPDEKYEPMTFDLLRHLAQEMGGVIQFTTPAPVVATSSEEAIDLVFPELVYERESEKSAYTKKHPAIRATRDTYHNHEIPNTAVFQRTEVTTGPFERGFDLAVCNGKVIQLVQCWSFQLLNQESLSEQIQSWAWVASSLKENGGTLKSRDGGVFDIPSDVNLASVYVPPTTEHHQTHAFTEALAAFNTLKITSARSDDADLVGEIAAKRLSASAAA